MSDATTQPTVILCEDDPLTAAVVGRVLGDSGIRVDVVADGHRVLPTIVAYLPAAVLLDIWLPGRNGIEILRELRRSPVLRAMPVAVISSDHSRGTVTQALELGADDYLVRPFTSADLRARVSRLLAIHRSPARTTTAGAARRR